MCQGSLNGILSAVLEGGFLSLTMSTPGASLFKVCLNCNLQGRWSIPDRTVLIFLTKEFLSKCQGFEP